MRAQAHAQPPRVIEAVYLASLRNRHAGMREHKLPDAGVQCEAVNPGANRDHHHDGRAVEDIPGGLDSMGQAAFLCWMTTRKEEVWHCYRISKG